METKEVYCVQVKNDEEMRRFFCYAKGFLEKATKEGKNLDIRIGNLTCIIVNLSDLEVARAEVLRRLAGIVPEVCRIFVVSR